MIGYIKDFPVTLVDERGPEVQEFEGRIGVRPGGMCVFMPNPPTTEGAQFSRDFEPASAKDSGPQESAVTEVATAGGVTNQASPTTQVPDQAA